MGDQPDQLLNPKPDASGGLSSGISRRLFLQGVLAASAGAGLAGSPTKALPDHHPIARALTADELAVLRKVLDQLIPAENAMPAAGALGVAGFIDETLVAAPHLRRPVVSILAALPGARELSSWSDASMETRLREIEQSQPEAFDLLLQATYTGYYRHPLVLAALGGVESDHQGELRLDCFFPDGLMRHAPGAVDV